MHVHMCVLWAVFVQFILVHRPHCASRPHHWPSCLNRPIQASRPVKSRSYRHSGSTDSTHRCCYECYQRSQFTEDNAEPSFLPRINSPCQFTVPPARSPVPNTPMWTRLTTMASQLASRCDQCHYHCAQPATDVTKLAQLSLCTLTCLGSARRFGMFCVVFPFIFVTCSQVTCCADHL